MSRQAIVGTAGHIDHGKTLLIKLLTGVDTDRLKEEKKRGISIELGFASLPLPSGRRCGVVDVPGHERFIRNMLAGAGGIDVILFVVAADEGIMPQTREHMDILQLLGVEHGVIALTKVDLVDDEWRELVTSELRTWIDATLLRGAPIIPVSSTTGRGRDDLLAAIDRSLDELDASARGRFGRMPIDRVFSMDGFGTVVTGTLWNGRLHEGDRVLVQPGGRVSRVKSLEVHGEKVAAAESGQRVAVCLHAVDREQVERGDWLVIEEQLHPVDRVDVRLHALPDLPKPIKHRARVRFYLGASEVMGRVVLLDTDELAPGGDALAQIQLEGHVVAERGDRFVLRSFSPMRTLGGGKVLDVSAARRRRFRAEDLAVLRVAEEGSLDERVLERIGARGGLGLPEAELTQLLGQPPAEIKKAVASLVESGELRRVGRSRLITSAAFQEVGVQLDEAILEQERAQPLRFGPMKSEIKSRLEAKAHPEAAEAWIQDEIAGERLYSSGDRLRRSSRTLELSARDAALRERMFGEIRGREFSGPTQKELLEMFSSEKNAAELLQLLVGEERVLRLGGDLLLAGELLPVLREKLAQYYTTHETMSVADLKEIFGVSRKFGVPLLELIDRLGWTERRGDLRMAGRRLTAE